tara:strand:+ start:726 stop:1766 length:1041 start_codon:yes stop_codon:yes gene_type:complete
MNFFNQKDEVIDIELTQYGKRMLSLGKFKPAHYAFFDKDILYNSECGIGAENQNDAEDRIKTGTPRLKPQYNFIGAETQFLEMRDVIQHGEKYTDKQKKDKLQDTENSFFAIDRALDTTKLKARYQPSWRMNFYSQNLVTASMAITSSAQSPMSIPQLENTLEYNTYIISDIDASNIQPGSSLEYIEHGDAGAHGDLQMNDFASGDHDHLIFEDESAVIVKDDFLLVGIEEEHTNFFKDNFEIQVFKVEEYYPNKKYEDAGVKKEKLIPLKFHDDEGSVELNPSFVEYFFEIELDQDIPLEILCSLVPEYTKKNLYLKDIFNCDDLPGTDSEYGDIYSDDDMGDAC